MQRIYFEHSAFCGTLVLSASLRGSHSSKPNGTPSLLLPMFPLSWNISKQNNLHQPYFPTFVRWDALRAVWRNFPEPKFAFCASDFARASALSELRLDLLRHHHQDIYKSGVGEALRRLRAGECGQNIRMWCVRSRPGGGGKKKTSGRQHPQRMGIRQAHSGRVHSLSKSS